MKIKIAENLTLPTEAITQTFAQIGRKGSGKTYLASMIAEQMLDAKAQVIVIDPIGNWWGLRVNADGKSKGKSIFVIGGTHGDVSLSSEAGKEIAKILAQKNISVVLDISEFRKNERKRFVTDFAEEFYHLKKTRPSAVHIFLEESQKFVPQRVMKDDARMLGAWEDIVRLGRNYGIGCSLISQRPQSVNKEVLSQVECLCILQITGLHERKALEDWVQEAGGDRKIIGLLPGLQRGEGYVWSPSWLRIFKKVKFNKKTTLDTSATPELGKATKVAKISKIDIEKLQKHMTEVIDNTTKELKEKKDFVAEINRLKTELRKANSLRPKTEIRTDERALSKARHLGYREAETTYSEQISSFKKINMQQKRKLEQIARVMEMKIVMPEIKVQKVSTPLEHPRVGPSIGPKPIPIVKHVEEEITDEFVIDEGEMKLSPAYERMLKACAMFHPNTITRVKISFLSNVPQRASTFRNGLSKLKTSGLIQQHGGDFIITEKGLDMAVEVEGLPETPEEIIKMWKSRLSPAYQRMLAAAVEVYPSEISKLDISEYSQVPIDASTFRNGMSKLKTLGLIKISGSLVTANEELFE